MKLGCETKKNYPEEVYLELKGSTIKIIFLLIEKSSWM